MEAVAYWTQDFSASLCAFEDNSIKTRTVDIGEHKLSLPIQALSQHPIERFSAGESALPMGLVPNPIHGFQGLGPVSLPSLGLIPVDQDTMSWRPVMKEEDQHSLCSSSSSGHGTATSWNQDCSALSDYRSNSLPLAFQEAALSAADSSYHFKSAEVIDPSLTLNYRDPDLYTYKEPQIKFEFPCFLSLGEPEYEHEVSSPESPTGCYGFEHEPTIFPPGTLVSTFDTVNWARKIPVTRAQAHHESRSQSHSATKTSSVSSSKSSRLPKSPISPMSRKRITRRRGSSSSEESPARPNARPKTYRKKIPFYLCDREDCKGIKFKNRSDLKKHVETQHTKPYICICGFATCRQRFGARNEWKRHIATQHLVLYQYVCDHPDCSEKNRSKSILFNRGDLFMKHHERMHCNFDASKSTENDVNNWKQEMRQAKIRCEKRRPPPQRMTCGFCDEVFERGDKTWMDLIDHVGLHFQSGNSEELLRRGYKDDPDLIAWMKEHGLLRHRGDADAMDEDADGEYGGETNGRDFSMSESTDSSSARQIKQEQMDA
ncbi:hypothetical protein Dda_6769 [Drechslerella dactyloides]|uniref:C2H2-type domain-containing protein n=1 Tax=Drechslerella dactyloides TaxID=74499 RepID=A0AAD6IUB4_DREDA|nr:hypothetical protein Dda_6769 [Drechslerella dactyloides]